MTREEAREIIRLSDSVSSAKEQRSIASHIGNIYNVEKWLNIQEQRRDAFVEAVLKHIKE